MQEMNIGLVSDEYHHTILISYISTNEQHLLHPPPFRHRITRQSGAVVNGSGLLHRACLRTGRTWASLVVFMSDRFQPRTERRGRKNRTTISTCIGQRAVGVTRAGVPAHGPRTSESRRRGRHPRMAPKGRYPDSGYYDGTPANMCLASPCISYISMNEQNLHHHPPLDS